MRWCSALSSRKPSSRGRLLTVRWLQPRGTGQNGMQQPRMAARKSTTGLICRLLWSPNHAAHSRRVPVEQHRAATLAQPCPDQVCGQGRGCLRGADPNHQPAAARWASGRANGHGGICGASCHHGDGWAAMMFPSCRLVAADFAQRPRRRGAAALGHARTTDGHAALRSRFGG